MKKKILVLAGLLVLCTGCGNKNSDTYVNDQAYVNEVYEAEDTEAYYLEEPAAQGLSDSYGASDKDSSVSAEESVMMAEDVVENGVEDGNLQNAEATHTSTDADEIIDREMLVYRGELCVDTLDFDTSVSDFKTLINDKGGFVESESYSDSTSTSGYYVVDETRKHNQYVATVRVPSAEYETIMNAATSLGDVRSRQSNVSNVTQQYSTYTSQLKIYEAEYDRYLELLEKATDDEYALQIENELFDIQIQIAQLKSGISNIKNDVAYSYIDITIKEVKEYEEEPAPSNTFADRFLNTCKQSWKGFLQFLENLLFFVIRNIYGIVVIVAVILVIRKLIKKKKAKKNENSNHNAGGEQKQQ